MRVTPSRLIALATMALVVAASPARAQDRGKHHGKEHGNEDRGGRQERDGNHDRDEGRRVIVSNGTVVPPGLARKPGRMPPGQYKKLYTPTQGVGVLREVFVRNGYTIVRTTPYNTSQYVYYRAPNGTIQRAIVSPGTSQLGFVNVPAAILQEVLARLR